VNISLTKAIWKLSNDKNVRYFVKTAYFIEEENDEDEITHAVPFKCIGAAHEKNYHYDIICNRHTLLFMDKINQ
jgi:hypothetical protein